MNCEICNTEFNGDSVTGLCEDCYRKAEDAFQRRKRQQESYERISRGIECGDLPANMDMFGFHRSIAELEQVNRHAWEIAKNWKPSGDSLWFWGVPGCGKSFLALCMARKAIWNGLSVCHVNARRLVSTLQRFEDGVEAINRWKSARLLLIDDIDKMNPSDYNITGLWEILDARVTNDYPTIVTSNWDPLYLRKCWTEQIKNPTQVSATLDRLKPCTIVEMIGKSNRGQVTRLHQPQPERNEDHG